VPRFSKTGEKKERVSTVLSRKVQGNLEGVKTYSAGRGGKNRWKYVTKCTLRKNQTKGRLGKKDRVRIVIKKSREATERRDNRGSRKKTTNFFVPSHPVLLKEEQGIQKDHSARVALGRTGFLPG